MNAVHLTCSTEPTGTIIATGAHGGTNQLSNSNTDKPASSNSDINQPASPDSNINQPASPDSDINQPVSLTNLSLSDMDIVSISSSNSISSIISDQVQDKNMEPSNTSLDSGSTGDTISDSGYCLQCKLGWDNMTCTGLIG